jgi:hypothetical protein
MEQEDKESLFQGLKQEKIILFQGLYLFLLDYL